MYPPPPPPPSSHQLCSVNLAGSYYTQHRIHCSAAISCVIFIIQNFLSIAMTQEQDIVKSDSKTMSNSKCVSSRLSTDREEVSLNGYGTCDSPHGIEEGTVGGSHDKEQGTQGVEYPIREQKTGSESHGDVLSKVMEHENGEVTCDLEREAQEQTVCGLMGDKLELNNVFSDESLCSPTESRSCDEKILEIEDNTRDEKVKDAADLEVGGQLALEDVEAESIVDTEEIEAGGSTDVDPFQVVSLAQEFIQLNLSPGVKV
jgi:hypothetical protein